MSKLKFDFVVVGAGIVGSWTAKELTKHGRVLLLEQFRQPHTRGSSHGQSRIIRSSYKDSFFADMMPHAYNMWRQAETEMNEKLIETTGVLCVAESPNNRAIVDSVSNMKRVCPEYLVELHGEGLKSKYPKTLKYEKSYGAIFDKSGGVIFASKAVQTVQQWFQNSGGMLWENCKVSEIIPTESKIDVVTAKGKVLTDSVIITAGPWASQFLDKLATPIPLEPQAVKVYYFKEKEVGAYSASSGFPALIHLEHPVYALPSLEYPGLMKVCLHAGEPCTPENRDEVPVNKEREALLRDYVKKHFPLLESEPSIIESCMYTCTPDEIFVIDKLPRHKNIIIGAGFSGTGFKTSPVVGRLLGELARGVNPFLDLSPYKMSRFSKKKSHDY